MCVCSRSYVVLKHLLDLCFSLCLSLTLSLSVCLSVCLPLSLSVSRARANFCLEFKEKINPGCLQFCTVYTVVNNHGINTNIQY